MQWTFVLLFARGLPDRRERAHTAAAGGGTYISALFEEIKSLGTAARAAAVKTCAGRPRRTRASMPSARRRIASAVSLLLVSELCGRKVSVDYDGGQTNFDDVELYLHSRSPKALRVLEHACNKGLMTDDQIEALGSLALQHRDVPLFRLHLRCSEGREENYHHRLLGS